MLAALPPRPPPWLLPPPPTRAPVGVVVTVEGAVGLLRQAPPRTMVSWWVQGVAAAVAAVQLRRLLHLQLHPRRPSLGTWTLSCVQSQARTCVGGGGRGGEGAGGREEKGRDGKGKGASPCVIPVQCLSFVLHRDHPCGPKGRAGARGC